LDPSRFSSGMVLYRFSQYRRAWLLCENLDKFHARKYFHEALIAIPEEARAGSITQQAMELIGELFKLERTYANLTPQERYEKRLEESKPKATAFFAWVKTLDALPGHKLGQAKQYLLTQEPYLMNVYLDGRLELTNNLAEQALRPMCVGRKNWLFSATPKGAHASAVLYSLVETAKANGLRPQHYLEYVLEQLPQITTSQIDGLLPWSESLPDTCRMPKKTSPPYREEKTIRLL